MKFSLYCSCFRNGLFNGDKHYGSADDVAVCRCKRFLVLFTMHSKEKFNCYFKTVKRNLNDLIMFQMYNKSNEWSRWTIKFCFKNWQNIQVFWNFFLKILFYLIFRVVFPMSYLIINIFYWNYYLGTQETVDTTVESYAL